MFTLRSITETSEVNNWLGDQYEVVDRETSYDRFAELFLECFNKRHVADTDPATDEVSTRCYAMVVNEKQQPMGIFKGQSNYIVTPAGKTFSNLTYKTK